MPSKAKKGANPGSGISPDLEEAIAKAEDALNQEAMAPELADDPIELGPRVISAEDIARKLVDRASAAAEDWKRRLLSPKKHPIKEGIAAEGKYKDKMQVVLREERRKKALEKVSDEDFINGVEAAGPDAFRSGIERKRGKVQRRFAVLQPLYELLAKALDAMPVDTEAQREAKMRAARRGMILVGKVRRGEAAPAEIAAEIKKLTGAA